MSNEVHLSPQQAPLHDRFFKKNFLLPSPARRPQVYIHLVIFFKYSSALMSSWLFFSFVSLFFLAFVEKNNNNKKTVAAGRPVSTINIV